MSPRDQEIRDLRADGWTLEDIGSRFGITRERARQIAGNVVQWWEAEVVIPLRVELTIRNPWRLRALCAEKGCLKRASTLNRCNSHQALYRYRHDLNGYKATHDRATRRYMAGTCPACEKRYAHIWQHFRMQLHEHDGAELRAQLRAERGLPKEVDHA